MFTKLFYMSDLYWTLSGGLVVLSRSAVHIKCVTSSQTEHLHQTPAGIMHHNNVCVFQECMIGEAQSLGERKRKAGGVKEMLHDATKLAHKIRFLVEEVRSSPCLCYSCTNLGFSVRPNCSYTHAAAPAHSARHLCVVVEQQQACCVRSCPSQRPAVLQQPGGPRSPLWQDNNTVSQGKHTHTQNLKYVSVAENHWYIYSMFHLQPPGKRVAGFSIQAKLEVYLWYGTCSDSVHMLDGLPAGFSPTTGGADSSCPPTGLLCAGETDKSSQSLQYCVWLLFEA